MRSELGLIYDDLRGTARRMLDRERRPTSLESTELVNLAFALLLTGDLRELTLADPKRVVGAAVLHMRRTLIDHARRRTAHKRPDPRRRVELTDAVTLCEADPDTLIEVDRLLDELARDPSVRNGTRRVEAARHAFYLGLSESEIAVATGHPKSTVNADLRFVRAWVTSRLEGSA